MWICADLVNKPGIRTCFAIFGCFIHHSLINFLYQLFLNFCSLCRVQLSMTYEADAERPRPGSVQVTAWKQSLCSFCADSETWWMRSNVVVRESYCQFSSRNSPGFIPVLRSRKYFFRDRLRGAVNLNFGSGPAPSHTRTYVVRYLPEHNICASFSFISTKN